MVMRDMEFPRLRTSPRQEDPRAWSALGPRPWGFGQDAGSHRVDWRSRRSARRRDKWCGDLAWMLAISVPWGAYV